jgi:methionyl-tRNA formyltransferase
MSEYDKTLKKVVIFAASTTVIPVINQLLQQNQLAGVVLIERVDQDSHQLEQQLIQAQIPYVRYQPQTPEVTKLQMQNWQADLGLVFTFSHILPNSILTQPKHGTFNLHASALPKYKGAMPLYWQIRNGERSSQLSIIKMDESIDSGDIVLQQPLEISPLDTLQSLYATVAQQAVVLVTKLINLLTSGDTLPLIAQQGEPSQAPFPQQQDLFIDWQKMTGHDISNAARAGNSILNGITLIWNDTYIGLLQSTVIEYSTFGVPAGTVLHVGEPEGLVVATSDSALRLDVITVAEGVYSGLAFANHFKLDAGVQFSAPEN